MTLFFRCVRPFWALSNIHMCWIYLTFVNLGNEFWSDVFEKQLKWHGRGTGCTPAFFSTFLQLALKVLTSYPQVYTLTCSWHIGDYLLRLRSSHAGWRIDNGASPWWYLLCFWPKFFERQSQKRGILLKAFSQCCLLSPTSFDARRNPTPYFVW